MRTRLLPIAGLLALAACRGGAAGSAPAGDEPEWISLFNGRDLSGWRALGGGRWRVEDGVLLSTGPQAGALVTERAFADFVFEADCRVSAGGNSGVFYRGVTVPDQPWPASYEYQIHNGNPEVPTGSVYYIPHDFKAWPIPAPRVIAKDDEWFRIRITTQGNHLVHAVNGRTVSVFVDGTYRSGVIGLQVHDPGMRIEFKDLRLRLLPPPAADGWIDLFNGRDLAGWSAHGRAGWRVENGVLVGAGGEPGALLSDLEYDDFIIEAEARANAGDTGGLLFRAGPPAPVGAGPVAYEALLGNRPPHAAGSFSQLTASRAWVPAPAKAPLAKDGEWFTLRVEARGSRFDSAVDGAPQATLHDDLHARGPVGVRIGGGQARLEVRRIRILPLERWEPGGRPWTDLFNGQDLSGWRAVGGADWRVENGVLSGAVPADGQPGSLLSRRDDFDDLEIEVEARVGRGGSGGVLFRTQPGDRGAGGGARPSGYEARLHRGSADADAGSLARILPDTARVLHKGREADSKDGEWLILRVLAQGPRLRTWVNGKPVAEVDDCVHRRGGIGLGALDAASRIEVRAVRVRPAPPLERESPIRFAQFALDASRNEGCAIGDIDKDGVPDVVAGPFWYAGPFRDPGTYTAPGPSWIRRPLREVAVYPPDKPEYLANYGDFLVDVDGDAWLDVVSGGWFDPPFAWYRNPGAAGFNRPRPEDCPLWEKRVIDELPKSEGALLVDLDGDGLQDYLLNSYDSGNPVAYWRLLREGGTGRFVRREVGKDGMLHGEGAGDVDGDGRPDILTPLGWYRAPMDRVGGDWEWNPWPEDLRLREDAKRKLKSLGHCGVPIAALDLTGDGLNDLIVGQGHDYGFEWCEQVRKEDGSRGWKVHPIDASFSQAHTLTLADLDGDGAPEVVTGKRWRAHGPEGDPGAKEPQCIFWFKWLRAERRFEKHAVSYDRSAGIGMQIAAADLDGDGDVDLATAGKGGLYVYYNLGR